MNSHNLICHVVWLVVLGLICALVACAGIGLGAGVVSLRRGALLAGARLTVPLISTVHTPGTAGVVCYCIPATAVYHR